MPSPHLHVYKILNTILVPCHTDATKAKSHFNRLANSLYMGCQWRHSVCSSKRRHVGGIQY